MKYITIIYNSNKEYYWIQKQTKECGKLSYGTAVSTDYGYCGSTNGHLDLVDCVTRSSTKKEIAYFNYIEQLRSNKERDKISLESFVFMHKDLIMPIVEVY